MLDNRCQIIDFIHTYFLAYYYYIALVMIEIKNVKKSFGDKTILHGVSSIMETGKCNLIIGTSGSGKTVLMKCMIGLFKPEEGEILYDGRNMLDMNVEERKLLRQDVGMLFQGSALFS